ncbi:MAG: hypothetical protein J0652_08275 [Desulfobulbaceae bacterium]|jgi:predicted  nucleic acid-binding Zn-ribbon protein|nr:hypothetical protein [Desulfobulbaceae bacterium]
MNMRNAYKQKIETELELIEARLAEFRGRAKSHANDARIQHAQQVNDLDQMVATAKVQLKDLNDANEDVWEQLKDGIDGSWEMLQSTLESTIQDFATNSTK